MNLDFQISFLPNTQTRSEATASLQKAVRAHNQRLFAKRDQIRSAASEEEQKQLKIHSTPCMVVAGRIGWKLIGTDEKGKPSYEKYMLAFSGFGQMDIDHLSSYGFNPAQIRDELSKLYFVTYAGISTRGDGVWLLIYLDCYDMESYTAQWTAAHEFVYSLLDKAAGVKVKRDSKGKNPTDFRFCIPDENGKRNMDARPFGVRKESRPVAAPRPSYSDNSRLMQLLDLIVGKRIDITSSYEDWRNLGFSLAATLGESGREWFHAVSQFHPKYKPSQTDKQYDESLKRNGYGFTEDFIFALARNHGLILKEQITMATQPFSKVLESDTSLHKVMEPAKQIADFEKGYPEDWDDVTPLPGYEERKLAFIEKHAQKIALASELLGLDLKTATITQTAA